jgi:hypothetical protein
MGNWLICPMDQPNSANSFRRKASLLPLMVVWILPGLPLLCSRKKPKGMAWDIEPNNPLQPTESPFWLSWICCSLGGRAVTTFWFWGSISLGRRPLVSGDIRSAKRESLRERGANKWRKMFNTKTVKTHFQYPQYWVR